VEWAPREALFVKLLWPLVFKLADRDAVSWLTQCLPTPHNRLFSEPIIH